jgi:coenzyme F420-reducing hydrogenase delta subunit
MCSKAFYRRSRWSFCRAVIMGDCHYDAGITNGKEELKWLKTSCPSLVLIKKDSTLNGFQQSEGEKFQKTMEEFTENREIKGTT